MAVSLSRKYHVPLVFTYHTQYGEYLHYLKPFQKQNHEITVRMQQKMKEMIPLYMNHFMKSVSLVFAPSRDMKKELLRQKDVPIVQVLPTGLSEEAFQKDTENIRTIRNKYLKDEKYLLLTVSRLEKEKNLYFLLDSISHLDQSLDETFKMMIIGDGGEKNTLQEYVREIGLEQRVIFTGEIPNKEISHYLGASDLFVFSSKSETQGIVLSEAMAAGLAVVAVEACGVRDIVKNGVNGCMTAEDAKTFAEVTGRLLVHEEIRKKMSKEALATAGNYEISKVAKQAVVGYEYAIEVWWNNYERRRYRYECRKADAV